MTDDTPHVDRELKICLALVRSGVRTDDASNLDLGQLLVYDALIKPAVEQDARVRCVRADAASLVTCLLFFGPAEA